MNVSVDGGVGGGIRLIRTAVVDYKCKLIFLLKNLFLCSVCPQHNSR